MKLKPIFYLHKTFFIYFLLLLQLGSNAQASQLTVEQLTQKLDSLLELDRTKANLPYALYVKTEIQKVKNIRLEGAVLQWIGKYYRRQEEYLLSLETFVELHHISSLANNSRLLCISNYELGSTYQIMDEHKKALIYLDKALQQATALDFKIAKAHILNEYGILHIKTNNYEKALNNLVLAEEIILSVKDNQDILSIYNNLGIAYIFTEQANKGLKAFVNVHNINKANKDSLFYAGDFGNIAFAYQEMGKMPSALMYYDSSIYYATKFHQNKVASVTYQDLYNAYMEMGNTKKALTAYVKYHELEKMAISESTKKRISTLEVVFETEKKAKDLRLAQNTIQELNYIAQIRLQRIFLITAGLIVGIFLYLRLKERLKRSLIEEKLVITALKNKQLETENLTQRLAHKNADLTSITLSIGKKKDFLSHLIQQLELLASIIPSAFHQQTKSIINFCNINLDVNDKLSSQHENIGKINHAFFQKLEQKHGKLSPNEKYLAGSFCLGFSNKEVASQKGISVSAAKMGRYRLRKKLQLSEEVDLVDYLQKL